MYRPAAARASLLYFILNDLHKINPIYQFSLKVSNICLIFQSCPDGEAKITCVWMGKVGGGGIRLMEHHKEGKKKAVRKLNLEKTPGADGIRAEMLNYRGEVIVDIFIRGCQVTRGWARCQMTRLSSVFCYYISYIKGKVVKTYVNTTRESVCSTHWVICIE